ncbi:MAG TPA: GDYXXLXY domain-containing protein [Cyclobacteriaceae bacterium]|nr:GDYXXLXY domain-containing protein [Cyclobacteriaceae bacterium]
MKYAFIIGFFVMVGAQWYVPLTMIFGVEEAMDEGVEYKFKTAPIDPSDPFRGKYVTLSFEAETYYGKDSDTLFTPGQTVYAVIMEDSAGFASIIQVLPDPPDVPLDYFEATYSYGTGPMMLQFPFNRFYVEESKASEAEQLYWQNNRTDNPAVCYAKVTVYKGTATLTDVMIGERSIVELVESMNATED